MALSATISLKAVPPAKDNNSNERLQYKPFVKNSHYNKRY